MQVVHLIILFITYVAANSIQFSGWIRDMSMLHNDFEAKARSTGPQQGLLLNTLNSVGRPIFRPPKQRGLTGSAAVFMSQCATNTDITSNVTIAQFGQFGWDEHYLDIPGVNIASPVTLVMNQANDGTYVIDYTQNWWFPINNMGYGKREGLKITTDPSRSAANPKPNNFWFTLQVDIPFYYRNATDVFTFLGDDDLYIFMKADDGMNLACDIGGVHSATSCNITLGDYKLTLGKLYTMNIYYAERQTAASNLKLTTTVQPAAVAPVMANGTTITTPENTPISFMPKGTDLQGYTIYVVVTALPVNGTLTANIVTDGVSRLDPVVLNTPYSTANTSFIWNPTYLSHGTTTMAYYGTNLMSVAPSANMTAQINTVYVELPPIPGSAAYTIYSNSPFYAPVSATDPDTCCTDEFVYGLRTDCVNGDCILPCITAVDTTRARVGDCIPGLQSATNSTQRAWLKYIPKNLGVEAVAYSAYDGETISTTDGMIALTIICDPSDSTCPPGAGLSGGALAGVIVGAIGAAALLGGGVAYLVYHKVSAAKNERQWTRDWTNAQISENPLYKTNVRESMNPLYVDGK